MTILEKKSPRIAFFYLYDTLEPFAFLRDALTMLAERGYAVDIFSPYGRVPRFPIVGVEQVQMFGHPEAFRRFAAIPRWLLKLRKGGRSYIWLIKHLYGPLANIFFKRFLRRRHEESPYACVIAEDPPALVAAFPYARELDAPLVFWSFELLFMDEITNPRDRQLKELEIKASRAAAFSIIQDEWRGEALCKDNGLDSAKLVYVPNAPRGAARRQRSDYLHRRLGIDPRRKIILFAGMFDQWTMSLELAQAAANWGEDYVLVMQTYIPRAYYSNHAYIDELVRIADPAHVVLSFDPVPAAQVREMMDSAEVGLAFYAPQTSGAFTQGRNVYLMGLSSSKLAGFLHSGLPVVVNNAVVGPKELLGKWGCGVGVSEAGQIGAALETIFHNYDSYAENAVRCFNQDLELGAHFEQVIARIAQFK